MKEAIRMDMNILKYLAFLRTVESGSFTRAADLLHYSQPGVSRMISDLEREWNVTLLERSRAGVRLTSDGLKLLPFARSVCMEYQKLQTEVNELNGLQSGLIRIGTFSSTATHWLPNIIHAFQKDYPNIEYELLLGDYAEIEEWIQDGRVDCGFVRIPTDPALETVFLAEDKLLAVLPENHPLASCDRFPVRELCKDPFMLLEKGGQADIQEIFQGSGLWPQARFTTCDDYAIMAMVEKGLGISILSQLMLRRIPYHIVAKELDIPAVRKIGFALRDHKTASLAVKRFLNYLPYREGAPVSAPCGVSPRE